MTRDPVERMHTCAADVLNDDERYLGAQALTIKGRAALGAWAEDVDLESILPNYLAQHGKVEELVVADDAIPNAFLAAVTRERVLLFSRSITGKPKELVEAHDLAATTLDVVDTGDKARSRLFIFGMPSGQVFAGECPINGKALERADRFVRAWNEAEQLSLN